MGNITPDFLLQMYEAFVHGRDVHASRSTPWEALFDKMKCLWPSRETALSMNFEVSFIGNTRPMPPSHWRTIPETARHQFFLDALPNPPDKGNLEYHAVVHCKVLYYACPKCNLLYVGSHNFSKSAWGLRGEMPKNVELGVVLAITSSCLRNEWKSHLPCRRPAASDTSPVSYIPASAHSGIRDTLYSEKVDEAVKMVIVWLQTNESELIEGAPSNDSELAESHNENVAAALNIIKANVVNLCDSD